MDMNVALKISAGVTGQQAVDQLRTTMDRLDGTVSKVRGAFMALGGAAVLGGFVGVIKGAIDTADKLNDMRQKTGIAVEELDALGFAAQLNGTTLDAVSGALGKLAKNMSEAAGGSREASATFAQFGISAQELRSGSITTTEALAKIADKISSMPDGWEKAAAAQRVFGKSAAEIIPLLNAGGDAIRDAGAELDALGGRMTGAMASAADEFNDNLTRINRSVSMLGMNVANELLPQLNFLVETLLQSSRSGGMFDVFMKGLRTAFETIVVLAANVGYVLVQIKNEMVGIVQQIGALGKLDFKGFSEIGARMRAEAAAARKEIDAFSEQMINGGRASAGGGRGFVNPALVSPTTKPIGGFDFGAGKETEFTKLKSQLTELAAKTGDVTKAQEILGLMRTEKYKDLTSQQKSELLGIAATIDAKKSQADTEKELKDFTEAASKARDEQYAREAYQINDFKIAQREKLELLQLEGQQANMTAVEYERRVQAIQHEYEVNRTVKDMLPQTAAQYREVANATFAAQKAVAQLNYEQSRTFEAGAKRAFNSYIDQIQDVARSTEAAFSNAFRGMEDALVNFVMTGKLNFKSLASSILADMARMLIQQQIMAPLMAAAKAGFGFANGGIMTDGGPLPLKTYSNGGIANSPQLAVYGEGRMPEAYVPLPDGRTIPVTMKGGGGDSSVNNVTVNVSVENGGDQVKGDQGADNLGRVIANVVKTELINQKRPGGLLA
jgi:lambda family phage tail tape measure protein